MRKGNRKNKNPDSIKIKRRKLTDEQIQAQIDKSIEIVNEYSKKTNEIRKRRQGKRVDEYKEELKQNKKNIELHSSFLNALSTATLLITVAVVSFLFARYSSIIGISINKESNISEYNFVNMVTSADDKFYEYGKELISYNNQTLKTYDKNGNVTWEYKFDEKFTPNIYINGKYMVASNNSSGVIYYFTGKKETFNKRIDGTIENVFLDESGNVSIEYSTSGYKKIIGVYTNKGEHLYNAYVTSDILVGVCTLENTNKLLLIKVNSASFKSGITISMLNIKDKNPEPYDIVTLDNCMLYSYKIEGNQLFMSLDNGIKSIDLNSKEEKSIKEYDSNQVLYISLNDKYYTLIEKEMKDTGESYKLENFKLDINGKNTGKADIGTSPKMLKSKGLISYLVFQNKISFYNKWGINVKNIEVQYPPKDIIPFRNGRSLALIYTNKICFVKI